MIARSTKGSAREVRRAGRRIGADVMGHLLEVMCRLANAMARQGRGSSAGDFVPNGRIGETGWRAAGEARRRALSWDGRGVRMQPLRQRGGV